MSRSAHIRALRPSARKVALLTLVDTARGAPLQLALSRALDSVALSPEARRQATDLAYWCLRAKTRCEFILSRVFPRFGNFSADIQNLLLAAAAALLFQEGAPAYAVVNETVEDIRRLAGKGIAGAANGGLRSLLRLGEAPRQLEFYSLPGDADDFAGFCRFTSFPESLGRTLLRECGEEAARTTMSRSFARPVSAVRLNACHDGFASLRAELLEKGAEALPGAAGKAGLVFPHGVPADVALNELAGEGRLSLQSAGSQLALAAVDFDRNAPVWDACCGFGGKTTALLEAGCTVSLASDTSPARLSALPRECARLGLAAPAVMVCDASRPPLARWKGCMLLDVPCSGLGVLSRRPDIKLRERKVEEYVRTQKAILERALLMVPGGSDIIYMTCTVTKSENGSLVRSLCHSFDASLEQEWATPGDLPFESMYAARIRVMQ
ncbi:MAG: transcription antitermination factor NusB [Desulfovibrionaceae bacterium]|nr:transcription antitermination factor NusB [Desulfovibrionaceae bacterium]